MTVTLEGRIPRPVSPGWEKGVCFVGKASATPAVNGPLLANPKRADLVEAPALAAYMNEIYPVGVSPVALEMSSHLTENPVYLEQHRALLLTERLLASRALRAAVGWAFDKYAPGQDNFVVEMGCGPELLLHELSPARLQSSWTAFDAEKLIVNLAAEKARRFGLPANVIWGDAYMPDFLPCLRFGLQPDLWVGLSSYDTVTDLALAFHQLRAVLRPGGRLIHIQDVEPSPHCSLIFHRDHPELGFKVLVPSELASANPEEIVGGLEFYFEDRQGRIFNTVEDFHFRMLHGLRSAGFNVVAQGFASALYLGEKTPEQAGLSDYRGPEGDLSVNGVYNHLGKSFKQHNPEIGRIAAQRKIGLPAERLIHEGVMVNFIVAENPASSKHQR